MGGRSQTVDLLHLQRAPLMVERERPVAGLPGEKQQRRDIQHRIRVGRIAREARLQPRAKHREINAGLEQPSESREADQVFVRCHSSVRRYPAELLLKHRACASVRASAPPPAEPIVASAPVCRYSAPLRAYARNDAAPVMPNASRPCACGRLRRATRALTQLYDDLMAPSGLRVTQFSLLRTLERDGPQRITALAAAALLDRTALSRTLDPLVDAGLRRHRARSRRAHARGRADARRASRRSGRRSRTGSARRPPSPSAWARRSSTR